MNPFAAPIVLLLGVYVAMHEAMCVALGAEPALTPDLFDFMGFDLQP